MAKIVQIQGINLGNGLLSSEIGRAVRTFWTTSMPICWHSWSWHWLFEKMENCRIKNISMFNGELIELFVRCENETFQRDWKLIEQKTIRNLWKFFNLVLENSMKISWLTREWFCWQNISKISLNIKLLLKLCSSIFLIQQIYRWIHILSP
jgi:hypothetical protein